MNQIELDILKAEKMQKLVENPLFKELILDEFIKEKAERIAMEFHMLSDENRKEANETLCALGILNDYINGIIHVGDMQRAYEEVEVDYE